MVFQEIIDPVKIKTTLTQNISPSDSMVFATIEKARKQQKLLLEDTAILLNAPPPLTSHIVEAASEVNERVHGKVITFYGVCYLSDFCINTCRYCGDNIYSSRKEWNGITSEADNNVYSALAKYKRVLTPELFEKDIKALLSKYPPLKELCILTGESPSLDVDRLIDYLKLLANLYKNKIILNIPPLSVSDFRKIRESLPNRTLHFRVFQETYDPDIYEREHPEYDWGNERVKKMENLLLAHYKGTPPKRNFEFRCRSQSRALTAGFDEVGLGVLFGLNDGEFGSKYEILALQMHAEYLYENFGVSWISISFPRILSSKGIKYNIPKEISENELLKIVSVTRLAVPKAKLIITCRERAEFRRRIRSIINIEDFEARPGPGGNLDDQNVLFQMEIQDRRKGKEILEEMRKDGYEVR